MNELLKQIGETPAEEEKVVEPVAKPAETKKAEKKEEKDDLFGDDDTDAAPAPAPAPKPKKEEKKKPVAKSIVVFDVKVYDQ